MLQAVYEDIIQDAGLILVDTLRNYVKAYQETIQEWEKDRWHHCTVKNSPSQGKKITPEQVNKLVNWLLLLPRNYPLTAPSLKLLNYCKQKLLSERE